LAITTSAALSSRRANTRSERRCGARHVQTRLTPVRALASVLARAEAREFDEAIDGVAVLPAALVGDPERIGEVVKGDHRREAVVSQGVEHGVVVLDLARVDAAALGLDATPLDREAMGVVMVRGRQPKVLIEALVVAAGDSADAAVCDLAGLLLEPPPIVEAIVAFHLVRRAGGAPQEARGELDGPMAHDGGSTSSIAARIAMADGKPSVVIASTATWRSSSGVAPASSARRPCNESRLGSALRPRVRASPARSRGPRRARNAGRVAGASYARTTSMVGVAKGGIEGGKLGHGTSGVDSRQRDRGSLTRAHGTGYGPG
jgi:hypothetical protein